VSIYSNLNVTITVPTGKEKLDIVKLLVVWLMFNGTFSTTRPCKD